MSVGDATATSAAVFTVTAGAESHGRDVTLTIGRKAKGRIEVTDGFTEGSSEVPVKVQRRVDGRWRAVGSTLSRSDGTFAVPGTDEAGRYRAVARNVTVASGHVCLKAVSRVVRG